MSEGQGSRLVCFLGIGRYEEVCWRMGEKVSSPQKLFPVALCELLPISEVFVLCTTEAKNKWFTTLQDEINQRSPQIRMTLCELPPGASEKELWVVFEKTLGSLDASGEAPPDVILDVTYGFRSQPMVALAAANFLLSERSRQREASKSLRIVYGAFESKTEGVAPVWDLTELLSVTRWSGALDALLKYGRADELESLGALVSKLSVEQASRAGLRGPELAPESFLKRLGKAARCFADDLSFARQQALMTESAPVLHRLLESDDAKLWAGRLPLLRPSLESLQEKVGSLVWEGNIFSEGGLRATARLVAYYGELQRFAEQAATLREGLVSHFAWLTGVRLSLGRGLNFDRAREQVESRWNALCFSLRNGAGLAVSARLRSNLELSLKVQGLRNDIEHCGMREEPSDAVTLRKNLAALQKSFTELLEKPSEGECFVNLTNHPVAGWSQEQKAAAISLGHGEPKDLSEEAIQLLSVPTSATPEEVQARAETLCREVLRMGAGAVMVSGEYTLTAALVVALQQRGARCFAATTERNTEEKLLPDGKVERKLVFQFVQMREYPSLLQ